MLLPLMGSQASNRLSSQEAPGELRALCASAHAHLSAARFTWARQKSLACAHESDGRKLYKLATRGWSWAATAELALLRYRSAAQAFLHAGEAARRAGDFPMEAINAFNLSNVYFHLGSLESATAALETALRLRDRAGTILNPVQLSFHHARLTARTQGIDKAVPLFESALELAHRPNYVNWQPIVMETYAVELLNAGRLPAAAAQASGAVRLREATHDASLSSAYLTLARVRLANNQADESILLVERAFDELKRHKPQRPLYAFFLQRALARIALGQVHAARTDLRHAVGHIREIRPETLPSDTFRVSSSAGYELVYAALAEVNAAIYRETGDRQALVESFETSAENRAQSLRAIAFGKSEPAVGYAAALRDLQAAELETLRSSGAASQAKAAQARLRLADLEVQFKQAASQLAPASLSAMQAQLRKGVALFHFQLGSRQSIAWVVTSDSLNLLSLPSAPFLTDQIRQFRVEIESGTSTAAVSGHELYKTIFGALPPEATLARQWVLVPDTALFHLPFSALVSSWEAGRPRYLIEQKHLQLAYFPGSPRSEASSGGGWQAFADPIYNTADPRYRADEEIMPGWHGLGIAAPTGSQAALRLPRLPGTARELAACSRIWPKGKAVTRSGSAVSIVEIQRALSAKPEVLHLATHLVPAAGDPEQSRLVLSLNPSGNPELLDAATVASLNARCRLVVMTGCRAGAGTAIASEGLLGLTRSWMVAGADAVAATYWPMPDDSGDLIYSFYRHWRHAPDAPSAARATHALRLAQIEMIRSDTWRARPRYWASYFVVGKS